MRKIKKLKSTFEDDCIDLFSKLKSRILNLDLDPQCVSGFYANADPYPEPATQIKVDPLADPDPPHWHL
jgi:hypothetical protein